ncbi:hypothetical protein Fmac_011558 [Flemingia macrophylla]|uniref:Bifunctional inhibitor/plant lipid transfer protein/seed storage helical domain-containing protein n=1 Tax=Flemingia macrophylla TaxID=520843 RepID=A0ABD1MNN2_9FABA
MARMMNTNIVILEIIGILVIFGANKKNVVAGACPGTQGLVTECAMYVEKSGPEMNPSQGCCIQIQNAGDWCLCQHITKAMLQFIDMQKVIFVAESCGKPIPPGTNCGGIGIFNQIN